MRINLVGLESNPGKHFKRSDKMIKCFNVEKGMAEKKINIDFDRLLFTKDSFGRYFVYTERGAMELFFSFYLSTNYLIMTLANQSFVHLSCCDFA